MASRKRQNPAPCEVLGGHRRQSQKAAGAWATSQPSISERRTIWITDAHRDGKRFVVRRDEKLTAFVELEATIRAGGELS
jgi:hypothetical protein